MQGPQCGKVKGDGGRTSIWPAAGMACGEKESTTTVVKHKRHGDAHSASNSGLTWRGMHVHARRTRKGKHMTHGVRGRMRTARAVRMSTHSMRMQGEHTEEHSMPWERVRLYRDRVKPARLSLAHACFQPLT